VNISSDQFITVASRHLPQGAWVVFATVTAQSLTLTEEGNIRTECVLRSNGGVIGGTEDERRGSEHPIITTSLSMNGGAVFGAGGGTIEVACRSGNSFADGQLVALQTGGFI
jgi:hypothetical protein